MPQSSLPIENTNIVNCTLLPTPREIKEICPVDEQVRNQIVQYRESIRDIIRGNSPRLLVVVGPCAIHDVDAGLEYADRLARLAREVETTQMLVMRVYFEKPRTSVGWKGLINDPYLDDSFRVDEGLVIARRFMLEVARRGLPIATEALDPVVPQYLGDLVSWNAIGARTSESQTHREMSSGLSTAVGFKNGTDGNLLVAVNAIKAASTPHRFLGINQFGQCCIIQTRGNPDGHMVLRGGKAPNYNEESITACAALMRKEGLHPAIMVDCSHGNSSKDPARQPTVFREVLDQVLAGKDSIMGMMLESNLHAGRQDLGKDRAALKYGVSITDGCIGWDATEELLKETHRRMLNRPHTSANTSAAPLA